MPYEPTNWQTGDIVSSERMNKIEQAVKDTNDDFFSTTIDSSNSELIVDTFNDLTGAITAGKTLYVERPHGEDEFYHQLIRCVRDKGPSQSSGRYTAELEFFYYTADTDTDKMRRLDY